MMQTIYLKHALRNWDLTLRWLYLIWKYGGTSQIVSEKVCLFKKESECEP